MNEVVVTKGNHETTTALQNGNHGDNRTPKASSSCLWPPCVDKQNPSNNNATMTTNEEEMIMLDDAFLLTRAPISTQAMALCQSTCPGELIGV